MSISNEIEEYYRELELEVGASLEEVNKAFRGLADIYHPDRFQNNPEARRKGEEKLKKINLAREKIKKYLASSNFSHPPPRPPSNHQPPPNFQPQTSSNQNFGEKHLETDNNDIFVQQIFSLLNRLCLGICWLAIVIILPFIAWNQFDCIVYGKADFHSLPSCFPDSAFSSVVVAGICLVVGILSPIGALISLFCVPIYIFRGKK